MNMIGRFFYLLFLVAGGIFIMPLKWLLMGSNRSRQTNKLIRQQREMLKRM